MVGCKSHTAKTIQSSGYDLFSEEDASELNYHIASGSIRRVNSDFDLCVSFDTKLHSLTM